MLTNKPELLRQESVLRVGAFHHAILQSAGFSSITTDEQGVIQSLNVGAERMFGYHAAEVIGRFTPAEFSDPQEVNARAAALSLEFATPVASGFEALVFKAVRGMEDIYELTCVRKDGTRFPAIVSGTALRDERDVIIGYLLIGTDDSARKEVEAAREQLVERLAATNRQLEQVNGVLRDREEKLAITLNSIGDAVIATDADARVTLMNPLAEQLTGWTLAEASGRAVGEVFVIIHQDTREPASIPVMETLARGTVQGLANHTVVIARSGVERAIADSCAPVRDRDGQVVGAVLVFRDVTDQYAAKEALREKALLIQTVVNAVVDGIITIRAQGGLVETGNPAAERMFGYAAGELVGVSVGSLIPELEPENHGRRESSLDDYRASAHEQGAGLMREVVGQRKDGSRFPLEMGVSEMALGGQRYFTGIFRDLSALRHAEEAQLKAGALQRAIFNSANFSSIATDIRGVIQIFNVGAERMLGYPAAEVMGRLTPADIADPDEVVARAEALSAELSTSIAPGFEALVLKASWGIDDIYELTYIRKDGGRFPALVSVTALRDARSNIIGYLLIGTDNTARKRVEAEQSELDQRLRDLQFYTRSLIEANVDALLATDPSGTVTDVNKQAEVLTGRQRDELIGASFKGCFTDPERAEHGIGRVLREQKVSDYELRVRAADGQETEVSCNATTFYDREKTLVGVFVAARDVSERKRLDEVLRDKNAELQTARLVADKANHAKSEFLSSMSHELRSPLNAILGFAQLMDYETPPATSQQKASIAEILRAGWYLLELINEILDLTVIESGKLPLSVEPVSIGDVLSECKAMMAGELEKRRLRLLMPEFVRPVFVRADRTRLKQVLVNLLSNAIKYNRAGGSVTVTCGASRPGHTRIEVIDTGNGLSPAELAQLFQPFNRLGQAAGAEEGTGIGLMVSRLLVEVMGGVIRVESRVGVGTTFWFELGTDAAAVVPGGTPQFQVVSPAALAGAQITILYVEDNPANVRLVDGILRQRSDVRLLTADNGILGVELARQHLPALILMDINLPGLGGVEATKVLCGDPRTAHIPVIAISANAMPADVEAGMEAGFFGYLTKPINIDQFMTMVNRALQQRENSPRGEKEE